MTLVLAARPCASGVVSARVPLCRSLISGLPRPEQATCRDPRPRKIVGNWQYSVSQSLEARVNTFVRWEVAKKIFPVSACLAALWLFSLPAYAQTDNATIRVVVRSGSDQVSGATVSANGATSNADRG